MNIIMKEISDLVGIPIDDGLLFELELARVSHVTPDAHCPVVVAINFSEYYVVY